MKEEVRSSLGTRSNSILYIQQNNQLLKFLEKLAHEYLSSPFQRSRVIFILVFGKNPYFRRKLKNFYSEIRILIE